MWAISGDVWDWSVALVDDKEWSVWGVSSRLCDVAVDRVFFIYSHIIDLEYLNELIFECIHTSAYLRRL